MSKKDVMFELESFQDQASIGKYLNALKEGFMQGKIILGKKGKKIIFEPDGMLRLTVKAKRKSGKVTISLKCSWKEGEPQESDSDVLVIE